MKKGKFFLYNIKYKKTISTKAKSILLTYFVLSTPHLEYEIDPITYVIFHTTYSVFYRVISQFIHHCFIFISDNRILYNTMLILILCKVFYNELFGHNYYGHYTTYLASKIKPNVSFLKSINLIN